jgi:ABC-type antimicrobial peptide transport system permease subunit
VYEDLPENTSFKGLQYLLPWDLYLSQNEWITKMENPWGSNFTQTFVQIADNADMEKVSAKIKDVKLNKIPKDERPDNPVVFLHPMRKWHLYSDFKAGINTGGRIDNVWLFGIIGAFVLLLACINFMNLSTARSEKRAKEVGIRKAIGSERKQLIAQFFSESIMTAGCAFLFSLLLVLLILPFFNTVADKKIMILWTSPVFWLAGIGFAIITGLIAGVYPALFLSSFQPVKVLKGTFRVGRNASLPRKVLVVMQFSISVILIIGTMVVYKQINHAKGRSIGYSRDGLITISATEETHKHFESIRSELKSAGAIVEMTESGSPTTDVWNSNGGFDWEGKDPNLALDFPNNSVTYEYGKTIGWKIVRGRDFSREFSTDSSAFILKRIGSKIYWSKRSVGKTIKWEGKPFTVIGVVEDMLVQSPYLPVRPSLFHISSEQQNIFIIKMNQQATVNETLSKIESTFKKYNPATPFSATFTDEEFAKKFGNEVRISTLASFFAILAILISCLGLFGLASFVAEQRTKEIGIRKVLGASVSMLWQLLSKDFVFLVIISCLIAVPTAWFFMTQWLQKYDYRTAIPWWVFVTACAAVLIITLLTVSYQAIKAAIANPVKSLKTE